jgi:hypothetical protein
MALQASGAISIGDLATEFGDSAPNSMSEFYSGGSLVANNAVNVNVPSSGAVSLSNYRGSAGTQTRNISINLGYLNPSGGVGLTTISSTATPFAIGGSANQIAYQPVFHAGTGFITSASITIQQNEDVAANSEHVLLYGGTSDSTTTNIVARWDAGSSGSTGGGRSYSIVWDADGLINSITYTGGSNNTGIISFVTDNTAAARTAGYKWYGFRLKIPSSFSKASSIMLGTFFSLSITQPS